ncbi:MAG: hypothetical protein ICCCNLDF_03194 [Planctomycetes bacterium]|nr:hypothetical protein [Planctomycetota bacterium]
MYEKSIDLIVLVESTGELWAIEAKVDDWRRAFGQALINQVVAKKSYIALWKERLGSLDKAVLRKWGIGVLAVGSAWGDVKVVLPAGNSRIVNRYLRIEMAGRLTGG